MRFGSVCSGIEAASVAWNPVGFEAAWLAEIEPFPCALLAHRYPDVPNLGDMTTIADQLREYGQQCRKAALEEAINCYSPDDTASDYIEKIRSLK